jgi:hypothetical protein
LWLIRNHKDENSRLALAVLWAGDGIATRYGLDGPGIESWCRLGLPYPSRPALRPLGLLYSTMGTGFSPRVKRLGRGSEYPPHLAPMLKKE